MPRSISALIKSALLVWAREKAGFSIETAAAKADIPADKLLCWEKGEDRPTIPQLIQVTASELLKEYPRLVDTLRGRSKADPFVIATAIERSAVVVTGEFISGNLVKPRIPDVCQLKGVRCINFLQMIRELKLTF